MHSAPKFPSGPAKGRLVPLVVLSVLMSLAPLAMSPSSAGASARSRAAQSSSCSHFSTMHTSRVDFRYPTCWSAKSYPSGGRNFIGLAYLSNQPMHNPCVKVKTKTSTRLVCSWPVNSLKRNGIVISWTLVGRPGLSVKKEPGADLVVSGRAAKWMTTTNNVCGKLHAAERIAAWVSTSTPYNLLKMTACIGITNVSLERTLVEAMLSSASVH